MILYGHHFFVKYKNLFCKCGKKVKRVNSKTSLLSVDSTAVASMKEKKHTSPDSDKMREEFDDVKFGVIYTPRSNKVDSPSEHIDAKSAYYYHIDAPYEVEDESEEESIHVYQQEALPFLPNYITTGTTPIYSSVASSGGQGGLRIIQERQLTPVMSEGMYQNESLLAPNGIRFMRDFSVTRSSAGEYHDRLDDILD